MNLIQEELLRAAKAAIFSRAGELSSLNDHLDEEIIKSADDLLRGMRGLAREHEDRSGVAIDQLSV